MIWQEKTPAQGTTPGPVADETQGEISAEKIGSYPDEVKFSPDVKATELFLSRFGRKQPTLSFIARSGKAMRVTRRYQSARSAAKGAAWFNNEGFCCYFVGNSHRLPRLNDTGRTDTIHAPSRADIELALGVWLDVDDPDPDIVHELAGRLDWAPTYIAFTGGGYQAHWRFDKPTPDIRAAEGCALGMMREFAGLPGLDTRCWSGDHLWRLPGTINRKPGRNRLVQIVQEDWSARLPMGAVAPETPPAVVQVVPVSFSETDWTLDKVRECISPVAWQMLARRPKHYASRSEHQFGFIGAVLCDGADQERIDLCAACLLATPADKYSVSHASYWESDGKPVKDPQSHVARQIARWLAKQGASDGSQ
jgi:hypothetical protein